MLRYKKCGLIWVCACWLLSLAIGEAHAQEPLCADTETIATCFSSRVDPTSLRAAASELNEKPTGSAAPGGENPTAISDYLPRLSAALLSSGVTKDLPSLNLATNLPLNDGVRYDFGVTLQAGLVLHQPEVNRFLLDSVAEARRAIVRERWEGELDELSNPEISASINLDNRRFGRSLRQHSDDLSVLLGLVSAAMPVGNTGLQTLHDRYLPILATRIQAAKKGTSGCPEISVEKIQLGCLEPEFRKEVERSLIAAADASRAQNEIFQGWVRASGFAQIADLVNNQPQLNTTFKYRPREEVIGGEEWELRFRGEFSPVNMNGARRFCRARGSPGLAPDCFRRYLQDPSNQASLRRSERLWVTTALSRANAYEAPFLAEDSATYTLPNIWKLESALGGGAYLNPGSSGAQRARIDVEVRSVWERAGERRLKPRIIGSAMYTLRLADNLSGTAGLVWSNNPSLLDRDLQRVRANVGVRYKLASKNP